MNKEANKRKIFWPLIFFVGILITAGVAIVLSTGYYNVKDYGLVDDSVTDNTSKLRSLIAIVPDGATIYFPGGGKGYSIGDSIILNKRIIIRGDGWAPFPIYNTPNVVEKGGTNIYFTSGTANLFIIQGSATDSTPVSTIENLNIVNTSSSTPTSGAAINYRYNVTHCFLDRISIYNFYNEVVLQSANTVHINDFSFGNPVANGIVMGDSLNVDYGVYTISNGIIVSGTTTNASANGILILGGGGSAIRNVQFNAIATLTPATQFQNDILATFTQGATSEYVLDGLSLDNYQGCGIKVANGNALKLPLFRFDNINVAPCCSGSSYGIWLADLRDVVMSNITGVGQANANAMIRLDTCVSVQVDRSVVAEGYTAGVFELHNTYLNTLTEYINGVLQIGTPPTVVGSPVQISNPGNVGVAGQVYFQPSVNGNGMFIDLFPSPSITTGTFAQINVFANAFPQNTSQYSYLSVAATASNFFLGTQYHLLPSKNLIIGVGVQLNETLDSTGKVTFGRNTEVLGNETVDTSFTTLHGGASIGGGIVGTDSASYFQLTSVKTPNQGLILWNRIPGNLQTGNEYISTFDSSSGGWNSRIMFKTKGNTIFGKSATTLTDQGTAYVQIVDSTQPELALQANGTYNTTFQQTKTGVFSINGTQTGLTIPSAAFHSGTTSDSIWGIRTSASGIDTLVKIAYPSGGSTPGLGAVLTAGKTFNVNTLVNGSFSDSVLSYSISSSGIGQVNKIPGGYPTLKQSADATGLTGAQATFTQFTPTVTGTYQIGGYLTITAISLDVIQLQVTYTDETSTSRTLVFYPQGLTVPGLSATGTSSFSPIQIRAKGGNAITVATVLTTGTGSITYDAGASITDLY
jgi:hypothetical protein